MVFSKFTQSCNHHSTLILEQFFYPKKLPVEALQNIAGTVQKFLCGELNWMTSKCVTVFGSKLCWAQHT